MPFTTTSPRSYRSIRLERRASNSMTTEQGQYNTTSKLLSTNGIIPDKIHGKLKTA
jgi:hypothetical protein